MAASALDLVGVPKRAGLVLISLIFAAAAYDRFVANIALASNGPHAIPYLQQPPNKGPEQ